MTISGFYFYRPPMMLREGNVLLMSVILSMRRYAWSEVPSRDGGGKVCLVHSVGMGLPASRVFLQGYTWKVQFLKDTPPGRYTIP